MKINSRENKSCIIGTLIISLLLSIFFLQKKWKNKYRVIGIIITSLFQSTFLWFYEGHVQAIHAVDQIILQVNFFICNKMMLSQSLILAL